MTRIATSMMLVAATLLASLASGATGFDRESSMAASWGSALAIQDPEPGFWRARPGALSSPVRSYSVGLSSLAAMTRLEIAAGHDLGMTNLGSSGVLVLESGALVLMHSEGPVFLWRGGGSAGGEPAPVDGGALLMRGDRITFHSSATVVLRNPEARGASLLMTTEIADLPDPGGEILQ